MAHALVFDTLQYAKKMKEVGFTDQQAEGQAEAIAEIINDQLLTKYDFEQRMNKIDSRFASIESRFESRFSDLESKIREVELRMTIKMGSMLVVAIGILSAVIKL